MKIVENFSIEVRSFAERLLKEEWVEEIRQNVGEMVLQSVQEISEHIVTPFLMELFDYQSFQTIIYDEFIPSIKEIMH